MDKQPSEIIQEDISKLMIGNGGFSSVYLCEDEKQNQYALKKIREVKSRYVQQELNALMSIKSPYIVKYIDNFVYKEYPIIVMEYCEQGTLDSYLKTCPNGVLNQDKALSIFVSILSGFRVIHETGFIHRDLKTSNILMKDGQIKISDFGLAMKATSTQMIQSKSCTPSYAAPEVLLGQKQGYKVDIWSLGVILYKMIYGCLPFDGSTSSKLLKKIDTLCSNGFQISKAPKKRQQDVSIGVIKLFRDIFVIDYKKRIGFKELYQSEIIQYHFKNIQDNLEFYEQIEKKDEVDMLQSHENNNNMNGQELISDQNNESDENEQLKKASLEREDAMITSILLQQKMDQTQQNLMNYSACINQYGFLIDNYIFFNQKINSVFDVINTNNLILLKFFLSKLILYYIQGLKRIIFDKENVFELKVNWAQFTASKTYKQLQDRIKTDYLIWNDEFENIYAQIKSIKQDKYPSLQQYFNDEFGSFNDDHYYKKIPDNIKLPYRAVLMTNLKMFYLSLKEDNNFHHNLNQQKTKQTNLQTQQKGIKTQHTTKQQSQLNLNLSPPPIIPTQPLHMTPYKLIVMEKNSKASIFLRLGLCAAWNRIFSVQNIYHFNNNKISYEELIQIIHNSDYDTAQKHTHSIMDIYFSNLKDFNYNFI